MLFSGTFTRFEFQDGVLTLEFKGDQLVEIQRKQYIASFLESRLNETLQVTMEPVTECEDNL